MHVFYRYNFLNRSVGISSLFEVYGDSQIVEAQQVVQVPGVQGFFIPAGTRGCVLRVVGENTALVRWEVNYANTVTNLLCCILHFSVLPVPRFIIINFLHFFCWC